MNGIDTFVKMNCIYTFVRVNGIDTFDIHTNIAILYLTEDVRYRTHLGNINVGTVRKCKSR